MHLVFLGPHGILDIHALATGPSWALVVGAGYGFLRMIRDATRELDRRRLIPWKTVWRARSEN
jgi:hypothetical protein